MAQCYVWPFTLNGYSIANIRFCENQLELLEKSFQLLETSNYFYWADFLGTGWCIETTQFFGFSKAVIIVSDGRFVYLACLLCIECLFLKMDEYKSPVLERRRKSNELQAKWLNIFLLSRRVLTGSNQIYHNTNSKIINIYSCVQSIHFIDPIKFNLSGECFGKRNDKNILFKKPPPPKEKKTFK